MHRTRHPNQTSARHCLICTRATFHRRNIFKRISIAKKGCNEFCRPRMLWGSSIYLKSIEQVDKVVDAVMFKKSSEGKVSNNPGI